MNRVNFYRELNETPIATIHIAPLYGATSIVPYQAAVLRNVFLKSPAFELPRLAIPVLGALATEDQK